jgi:hypothetical protein
MIPAMQPVVVAPEPPPPDRPKAVTVIGWTFLVLSTVRVLEDTWGWFLWKFGDAEKLVLFFLPRGANALVPVDALFRNFGTIVAVQAVVAACVAVISWNFLRLRPWARTALEVVCWIALGGTGLAVLALAFASSRFGPNGVPALPFLLAAAIGVGILLAVTIRIVRRPQVRNAFDDNTLKGGLS